MNPRAMGEAKSMLSERLMYEPATLSRLDDFHRLVEDAHVRRYMMDGQLFPRAWSEARVLESLALLERRGVGLWLAAHKATCEIVGFCGFLEMRSVHPEPQLVYAMFERFTGNGYATEMARASIDEARRHAGFESIYAAVDTINSASLHVLEKLGFRRAATHSGAFGELLVLILGS